MQLFIDTANLSEIKDLADAHIIDGVTTNPSLMAKEGISGNDNWLLHYKKISQLTHGPVSAEVIATDVESMIEEAFKLSSLHSNIVVKIPMTKNGIKAIHYLNAKGVSTNCTLIFSVSQALLAAKAGATYVSPFIGRLDDVNENGIELIQQIKTLFNNYNFNTKILAASIRNKEHLINCALVGADIATVPYPIIEELFKHPLTTKGLNLFLADYAKLNSSC